MKSKEYLVESIIVFGGCFFLLLFEADTYWKQSLLSIGMFIAGITFACFLEDNWGAHN